MFFYSILEFLRKHVFAKKPTGVAACFVSNHGSTDNGKGNNGQNNGVNKKTDAPFDTSVGILIAAGVALGLYKAYDIRKQNKAVNS